MSIVILEKSDVPLIPLEEAKAYLRIDHDLEDPLILTFIQVATLWVEQATGKTLLTKTFAYSHEQTRIILPCPPVLEILEVKSKRGILEPKEYLWRRHRDTVVLETPFFWGIRTLTITYRAGFGDTPEDVPPTLRYAVLTTLAYLYENRPTPEGPGWGVPSIEPWIQYHRRVHLA
jgi:uncharacterized phiE125 gp8 family phage protein